MRFGFHVSYVAFFFFFFSRECWLFPWTVYLGTVHKTHKHQFSATFSLKMGPTVLFTHLKFILLQCFQFSVFRFQLYLNGPIVLGNPGTIDHAPFAMKRTGVKVFNYIEIWTVKSDFILVDLCSLRDLGFILFKSLPKANV